MKYTTPMAMKSSVMNLTTHAATIGSRLAFLLPLALACGSLSATEAVPLALRPQLVDRNPPVRLPKAATPTDSLEQTWPGYPEALAMFAEIVAGNPEFGGLGWFRKAVSKTRFDWNFVAGRLDRNGDGIVDRAELKGSDEDFRRLDRNRDSRLTEPDFDFLGDSRPEAIGIVFMSVNAFNVADRDGDSRVTPQEWEDVSVRVQGPIDPHHPHEDQQRD